jgi:thiol-disulfide isomerase/thioredoxin
MNKLLRQRLLPVGLMAIVLGLSLSSASARTAPNLDLKDLAGHKQKLASTRGQIVVLSFWATWCTPCQEELPRLSKLSEQYAGKNVRFVAVSIDEPKDRGKIQPFLDKQKVGLEVWVGASSDDLARFGLGDIVPGTVVLDPQGELVGRIMGEARDEDVRSRVDWLLGGRQGTAPEPVAKRY